MTLRREKVTVASRIMLPTYVALTAAFGLIYLINPLGRLDNSPALTYPRMMMGGSMAPWGALFLAIAVTMAAAMLSHWQYGFLLALCCCAAVFLMWAGMYCASIKVDPNASLTSPIYPLFVVRCCYATTRSLLKGEV